MTERTSRAAVRAWAKPIFNKLAGAWADKDKTDAFGRALDLAARRLPPEAFVAGSADAILDRDDLHSMQPEGVARLVDEWWAAHRPAKAGEIPDDIAGSGLPKDSQRWAAYWRTRVQQGALAPSLRGVLGVIRAHDTQAFDWLARNDVDALAIVSMAGWRTEGDRDRRMRMEWGNPDNVRKAVGSCLGVHDGGRQTNPTMQQVEAALRMLRLVVRQWAPDNAHLVPATAEEAYRRGAAETEPASVFA